MIQRALLLYVSPLWFNHTLGGIADNDRKEMYQWCGYAAASDGLHPFLLLQELGCITLAEQPLTQDASVAQFYCCKEISWELWNKEDSTLEKHSSEFSAAQKPSASLKAVLGADLSILSSG